MGNSCACGGRQQVVVVSTVGKMKTDGDKGNGKGKGYEKVIDESGEGEFISNEWQMLTGKMIVNLFQKNKIRNEDVFYDLGLDYFVLKNISKKNLGNYQKLLISCEFFSASNNLSDKEKELFLEEYRPLLENKNEIDKISNFSNFIKNFFFLYLNQKNKNINIFNEILKDFVHLFPFNNIRLIFYFSSFYSQKTKFPLFSNFPTFFEKNEKNEKILNQINCDIPRTFPNLKNFQTESIQTSLKNVLIKISQIDKELEYVQGINFLVGFLLILTNKNEEITLFIFFYLMNLESELFKLKYKDVLTKDFKLLHLFNKKFSDLIYQKFPKIQKKIEKNEICEFLWVSKWFQTLFTYCFDFGFCARILDFVVFYGIDVIIVISVLIVEFNFDELSMKFTNMESFIQFWENFYDKSECDNKNNGEDNENVKTFNEFKNNKVNYELIEFLNNKLLNLNVKKFLSSFNFRK